MIEQTSSPDSYPVQLDVATPERYERLQLLLRFLICAALGMIHQSLGGVAAALYLLLPTLAAILISQRTAGEFLARDAVWIGNLLEWLVGFYAYMLFVTDRFPLESDTRLVRLRVASCGSPSLLDALSRLLASIPHALVLALLAIVSGVVSFMMAVCILFNQQVPDALRNFQRDFLGWLARFFAYHASLIDVYPPIAFSTIKRATPRDDFRSA